MSCYDRRVNVCGPAGPRGYDGQPGRDGINGAQGRQGDPGSDFSLAYETAITYPFEAIVTVPANGDIIFLQGQQTPFLAITGPTPGGTTATITVDGIYEFFFTVHGVPRTTTVPPTDLHVPLRVGITVNNVVQDGYIFRSSGYQNATVISTVEHYVAGAGTLRLNVGDVIRLHNYTVSSLGTPVPFIQNGGPITVNPVLYFTETVLRLVLISTVQT